MIDVDRWRMRPSFASADGHAPVGELEFKYHISGSLAEPFQLPRFPFDVQSITITLSSAIPTGALQFHRRGDCREPEWQPSWPHVHAPWAVAPDPARFSATNVFAMSDVVHAQCGETSSIRSTSGTSRPWFKMSLAARRLPNYYVVNVLLPI